MAIPGTYVRTVLQPFVTHEPSLYFSRMEATRTGEGTKETGVGVPYANCLYIRNNARKLLMLDGQ
jgi:hypothetical protein